MMLLKPVERLFAVGGVGARVEAKDWCVKISDGRSRWRLDHIKPSAVPRFDLHPIHHHIGLLEVLPRGSEVAYFVQRACCSGERRERA